MSAQAEQLMEQCGAHLLGPGLEETTARSLIEKAVERYSEPWRFHHVGAHLGDVTGFLVANIDELRRPRPTLWAAVGHDLVYVPHALPGVNEELSGQQTEGWLEPFLPKSEVSTSGTYIRRTAKHEWDGKDTDLAYFLDADLKILGAPPDEFDEYDENIRREYAPAYANVDPEEYRKGRLKALTDFYDQPRIFITDTARELYEEQAQANLERAIDRLSAAG